MRRPGSWFRPEIKRQVRGYSAPELRRAAIALYEADTRLKSSSGSPRLVLETLVRQVAGGEPGPDEGKLLMHRSGSLPIIR
jgi:DNA polymerase III delta subunit